MIKTFKSFIETNSRLDEDVNDTVEVDYEISTEDGATKEDLIELIDAILPEDYDDVYDLVFNYLEATEGTGFHPNDLPEDIEESDLEDIDDEILEAARKIMRKSDGSKALSISRLKASKNKNKGEKLRKKKKRKKYQRTAQAKKVARLRKRRAKIKAKQGRTSTGKRFTKRAGNKAK